MELPEIAFQSNVSNKVDSTVLLHYTVLISIYYFLMLCWLKRNL